MNISLRKAHSDDLKALQELAIETICETCRHDYNEAEIKAWTSAIQNNEERWYKSLETQYFLVAEVDKKIAGFASLDHENCIDFLYVHKDFVRKGIARKLFGALKHRALELNMPKLISYVSKTAVPFFEKMGFEIIHENVCMLGETKISNFLMKKIP